MWYKKGICSLVGYVFISCVLVLFLPSCKDTSSGGSDSNSPQQNNQVKGTSNQTSANTNNEAKASNSQTVMEPIPLELPKAVFVGTPQDFRVPNLEEPLGHERPPFPAPAGTKNVALGKPVTSSDPQPIIGELSYVTDGDKEATEGSYVELAPLKQHITIELEGQYKIYAIVVWHFHKQARVYHDVIVQLADDPDFTTGVKTLFNNDYDNSYGLGVGQDKPYVETAEGKLIDAKGLEARYVRLHSNRNTSDGLNDYTEVEVYGKAVK